MKRHTKAEWEVLFDQIKEQERVLWRLEGERPCQDDGWDRNAGTVFVIGVARDLLDLPTRLECLRAAEVLLRLGGGKHQLEELLITYGGAVEEAVLEARQTHATGYLADHVYRHPA